MVNGSLNYLNSDGEFCEADNLKLIQKFNDCISLNESYHNAYNEKFKEKLDKTFIFEKFDAFSSRCSKLILIFKTIDDFDHLKNCEIKEMSLIAEYFVQNINFALKLNNKQILDLKNKEFEKDFENFKSQCVIEDSKIRQIISKRFQLTKTVLIEIKLHKTLKETVTRKEGQLELDLWFKHCLKRFKEDIDEISQQFKKSPYNDDWMSSIGQLEMRLTEPVEIFKKYNEFMNNKEIITKYNDTLFELLQCKNIEIKKTRN